MGYSHYNSWTGLPCNCPWGAHHGRLAKLAGQETNRILKAPDKAFRTPEGEAFKQILPDVVGEDHDSLAPYIANRFKKGDIQYHPGWQGERGGIDVSTRPGLYYRNGAYGTEDAHPVAAFEQPKYMHGWSPLNTPTLTTWNRWYQARQHPTRRGVNVMDPDFTPQEMNKKVQEHNEALEQERMLKEELSQGDVVHKFPNGWHVRHLNSPGTDAEQSLEAEGRAMGHCIGSDEQPYMQNAIDGDISVYSLRDKKGWPHGTWHTNPDGSIAEIHGNDNNKLSDAQHEMYEEWCRADGKDPEPVGHEAPNPHAGDEEIEIPGAENLDTYEDHHHPYSDHDYYEEAGEYGNVGEDTNVYPGNPKWDELADDLHNRDPKERQNFYNLAHHNGDWHYGPLRTALQAAPEHEKFLKEFEKNHELHYDAQGNYVAPQWNWPHGNLPNKGWQTGWDKVNRPLWKRPHERVPHGVPLSDDDKIEINAKTSGWKFSANPETGEGYEWGFSEPHVTTKFPEEWDESFAHNEDPEQGRRRIPFMWTHDENDHNDVRLWMGHPGSYHDQLNFIHRIPHEDYLGGYGSVKPRSYQTGNRADRDQHIEYYTVHDPRAMGSVANELTKHFDVQNRGFENEPYRKPVSDQEDEYDYEMQQGRFGAVSWPEPILPFKTTRALGLRDGSWRQWDQELAHAEYMLDNGIKPEDVATYAVWEPHRGWKDYEQYRQDYSAIYNRLEGTDWKFAADFQLPQPHPDYKRPNAEIPKEEIKPWRKGNPGKFLVYPDGHVISWSNHLNPYWHDDENPANKFDGWPAHDSVANSIGRPLQGAGRETIGYIRPNGEIMGGSGPLPVDHAEAVMKQNPGTFHEHRNNVFDNRWKFANEHH